MPQPRLHHLRTLTLCSMGTLALLLVTACGDDDGATNNNTSADAALDSGPDAAPDAASNNNNVDPIVWEACPLRPDYPSGRQAECAWLQVPLRHAEPDGPTIDMRVQRVRTFEQPRRGQVWILQGGPGGASAHMASFLWDMAELAPHWDYYTVDHRGVGNSARLGCPDQEFALSEGGFAITEGEVDACLQYVQATWGADLAEFTTTAAARDMGLLVDRLREPDQEVVLYGVSYGTYWLFRYLQLFPDAVDGVILDSVSPPGRTWEQKDWAVNEVGRDFMELCQTDTLCASHLGSDPWATMGQVFDDFEQGSCPAVSDLMDPGTEKKYLRAALAALLKVEPYRELAPAVIHRLERCDAKDATAISNMLTYLWDREVDFSEADKLGSDVLLYNVALSEHWSATAPDASTLAAEEETYYFSWNMAARFARLHERWPLYPHDQYVGQWPTTDTPLLMAHGTLDPQIPIWSGELAEPHMTGAQQYFYHFPNCVHGLINSSKVETPDTEDCFLQMMQEFLDDHSVAPSSACLSDLHPVDFSGDHPYSQSLFGTPDMWDNPPPAPAPLPFVSPQDPLPVPSAAKRVLLELRRNLPPPRFLRDPR